MFRRYRIITLILVVNAYLFLMRNFTRWKLCPAEGERKPHEDNRWEVTLMGKEKKPKKKAEKKKEKKEEEEW